MIHIETFNKAQEFFIMTLIQQNLLNIYDVLGIVLSTKNIKLNKIELRQIDLKEIAGMKYRCYKWI